MKSKPRVRSTPKHRNFRLSRKKLKQYKTLPGAVRLLKDTSKIIRANKTLFIGITLINVLISFVFVQGLGSSFNIVELKQNIEELFGQGNQLSTAATLFGFLLGSAGSTASEGSGAYQFFLTILISLVVIWCVRQIQAGKKPAVKDGFYRGVYPLIPFLLVLFVIGLQLIPLIIGNVMYSTVIQNGLAITSVEKVLWFLIFICLAMLSAYMLTSSIFALYISTLPDMTPMQALRSARELVLHRRWAVWLRIIALPLVLIAIGAIIFIPLLIFATAIVQVLFLVMASFSLVIVHIYMYLLYRSMI
jgi:hypothetical protein